MGDSMFFYDQNILHIGNFIDVSYVEEDLIIVKFKNYQLEIYGNNLKIINLSDDEMYIQGVIIEMDLKR